MILYHRIKVKRVFTQQDRDYFDGKNGKPMTSSMGFRIKLVYEDGEVLDYFDNANQIRLKCPGCEWWNLDPVEPDGSTGGGGYILGTP